MASRSVARTLQNALSTSRSRSMRASCASCRFYATPAAASTSSAATPAQDASSSAAVSPKISQIVDQISTLSLLEAAELVTTLKTRLNIADIAVAAPVAAAPAGGAAAGGEAAAEAEKPKEKTVFTVTLTKIDAAQKAKVIKEVKQIMPNMNLVEAKKFVENLPQTLKENAPKDDIEKLKKALEAVGASVEIS